MNPLLKDIFALAKEINDLAAQKGLTVSTAESCTGGLIGGALTAIPGSSQSYLGGAAPYSNALKISILGVKPQTIKTYGAVSKQTAIEMAQGAQNKFESDLAVSVTGIAGPGGGSPEKPVGTVWIGLASKNGVSATLFEFGDMGRNRVRDNAVLEALKLLKAALAEA